MSVWAVICPCSNELLCIVQGDYKKGDVPPPEAYTLKNGRAEYHPPLNEVYPELVCTNPKHEGKHKPIWREALEDLSGSDL